MAKKQPSQNSDSERGDTRGKEDKKGPPKEKQSKNFIEDSIAKGETIKGDC